MERFRWADVSDAELQSRMLENMTAANNQREFADQCVVPAGKSHHWAAAARFDRMAALYRAEMDRRANHTKAAG